MTHQLEILVALTKDLGSHGGSQPSVSPVLWDPVPSREFCGHQAHTWHTHIHSDKCIHT